VNVLLTNPNYKHTWILALSFFKKGYKVYCLSKSRLCLLGASKFVEKIIFIKHFTKDKCESICINYDIDIIVPVGFEETFLLSKILKNSIFANKITAANHEKIAFASDKNKISKYIDNLGLSVPRVYAINNSDLADAKTYSDREFFLKPSKEGLIKKYFKIENSEELNNSRSFFKGIGYSDSDLILQEFINGEGVGYFAICYDGEPVVEYSHQRIREWPKKGGYSTACKIYENKELTSISRKIIRSLKWRGPIMIEYKKNKNDGKFYFIEINPKFWGSLELGILSNVNIIDALTFITSQPHNEPINKGEIERNMIAWPLDGDAFHYFSSPSLLIKLLKNDSIVSTGILRDPFYGLLKLLYFPLRLLKEFRL